MGSRRRQKRRRFSVVAGAIAAWAGAGTLLGAASSASAQTGTTYQRVPLGTVQQSAQQLAGRPIAVEAKYDDCFGDQLIVHDISRQDFFRVADAQLRSYIIQQFAQDWDNILVSGRIQGGSGGAPLRFSVERVDRQPNDLDAFRAALGQLGPEDAQGHYRLAERTVAEATARAQDQSYAQAHERYRALAEEARQAYGRGVEAELRALPEHDVRGRLRVARLIHERLGDRERAIREAQRCYATDPSVAEVRDFLRELGAYLYRGEWVSFDVLRQREGYVRVGEAWVTPERAALLERVAQRSGARGDFLRIATENDYRRMIAEHRIENGMRKPEVAASVGFASYVDRVRVEGHTYDFWGYDDGRRVYFERASSGGEAQVFAHDPPRGR